MNRSNNEPRVIDGNRDFAIYFDIEKFDHSQRIAKLFSESTLVPDHYKKNIPNCFIALQMATRMGIDPLVFMQKSFVINGKPGIEAQIAIGALNNSGLIKGRINYELTGEGENRKCIASAIDAKSNEARSYTITLKDALKVGNASRNTNWQSMPDLMLCYRAATYLIRLHYPDVLLGLSTKDELQDIRQMIDVSEVTGEIKIAQLLEENVEILPQEQIGQSDQQLVQSQTLVKE